MSSPTALLQDGIESVQQERYSEAIETLEAFCRRYATSHFKDYIQAQTWLIKAYQENGQLEQAIALCHRLAANKNAQVRTLAQKILPSLSESTVVQRRSNAAALEMPPDATIIQYRADAADATVMQAPPLRAGAVAADEDATLLKAAAGPPVAARPTQTLSEQEFKRQVQSLQSPVEEQSPVAQPSSSASQETDALSSQKAEELLETGNKALKYGRYVEAVEALEEFCRLADPITRTYTSAQKSLVKAYKGNDQIEDATALCQELMNNEQEIIQIWAKAFIRSLTPAAAPAEAAAPATTSETTVWSAGKVNPLSQDRDEKSTRSIRARRMTRRIFSVMCYGAVLFSAAFVPAIVPFGIWRVSKDEVIRSNAKEALNFFLWLWSCWILIGLVSLASAAVLPIATLVAIPAGLAILLGVVGALLSLVAAIACIMRPSKPYFYPFIWRVF